MLAEDDNLSDCFINYKEEEYSLSTKKQDVKKDQKDLIGKNSDNESIRDILPRHTPQDGLFVIELLSSLREIRFSKKEVLTSILISDIKYDHLRLQNHDPFYMFNHQLDYILAHFFLESKTMKSNIDKFLSNLLMILQTEKLSYQNADK